MRFLIHNVELSYLSIPVIKINLGKLVMRFLTQLPRYLTVHDSLGTLVVMHNEISWPWESCTLSYSGMCLLCMFVAFFTQVSDSCSTVDVNFTPTIPHCSMATLIGLSIKVKLLRSLPSRFKVKLSLIT